MLGNQTAHKSSHGQNEKCDGNIVYHDDAIQLIRNTVLNNLTWLSESTMSEYLLFTTTRYDEGLVKFSWNNDQDKPCPFLLRANHYQRLVSAAWDHEWTRVLKVLEDYEKFKLLLDEAVQSYKMSINTDPIALRARCCQFLTLDQGSISPGRCELQSTTKVPFRQLAYPCLHFPLIQAYWQKESRRQLLSAT